MAYVTLENEGPHSITLALADSSSFVLRPGDWARLEQSAHGNFLHMLVLATFHKMSNGTRMLRIWNRDRTPFTLPAGWRIENRLVRSTELVDLILPAHSVAIWVFDHRVDEWLFATDMEHATELAHDIAMPPAKLPQVRIVKS